jgi:cob(I)alamin adenosyltransferase
MIHLYTGEGEGKTIAALGLALRALGHGKRVVVIQFMKGRTDTGEFLMAKKLAPDLRIHQFGRVGFVDLKSPEPEDKMLAEKGLAFAKEALRKKPDLLILDEINLAVSVGLLSEKKVIDLLGSVPADVTVVLTGRRAPKAFIERANLATEMMHLKHPFDVGVESREGLDY